MLVEFLEDYKHSVHDFKKGVKRTLTKELGKELCEKEIVKCLDPNDTCGCGKSQNDNTEAPKKKKSTDK